VAGRVWKITPIQEDKPLSPHRIPSTVHMMCCVWITLRITKLAPWPT